MNRRYLLAPLLCALMYPVGALADSGNGASVQDLANLQSQEATLAAKKKVMTLRLDIQKLRQQLGDTESNSSSSASAGSAPAPTIGPMPSAPAQLPHVISIAGMAHHLVATVSTSGGGSMEVQKGDFLPGRYRVVEINSSGVEVYRKGQRQWLEWGATGSSRLSSGSMGGSMFRNGSAGLPAPPPPAMQQGQ